MADYDHFLDLLKQPEAAPLMEHFKGFLQRFGAEQRSLMAKRKLVASFLHFIYGETLQNPLFMDATADEELENIREGWEKLVMINVYTKVFNSTDTDDSKMDQHLDRKIQQFSWIEERHLDLPFDFQHTLEVAQAELLRVNGFKSPRDKLITLQNTMQLLVDTIKRVSGNTASSDHLLPSLILTIVRANPPHLIANVKYVMRFRNQQSLDEGANQYCLTNFMSSVSYLYNVTLESLTLKDDEKPVRMAFIKNLTLLLSGGAAANASMSNPPSLTQPSTPSPPSKIETAKNKAQSLGDDSRKPVSATASIGTPGGSQHDKDNIRTRFNTTSASTQPSSRIQSPGPYFNDPNDPDSGTFSKAVNSAGGWFNNMIKEVKTIGEHAAGRMDNFVTTIMANSDDEDEGDDLYANGAPRRRPLTRAGGGPPLPPRSESAGGEDGRRSQQQQQQPQQRRTNDDRSNVSSKMAEDLRREEEEYQMQLALAMSMSMDEEKKRQQNSSVNIDDDNDEKRAVEESLREEAQRLGGSKVLDTTDNAGSSSGIVDEENPPPVPSRDTESKVSEEENATPIATEEQKEPANSATSSPKKKSGKKKNKGNNTVMNATTSNSASSSTDNIPEPPGKDNVKETSTPNEDASKA